MCRRPLALAGDRFSYHLIWFLHFFYHTQLGQALGGPGWSMIFYVMCATSMRVKPTYFFYGFAVGKTEMETQH